MGTGGAAVPQYHTQAAPAFIAHLLHDCALRVRANLKNIDDVVATIKPLTIKNKDRKKDFHKTGLPLLADS